MIYFFADNHFGQHPGGNIYEHLPEEIRKKTVFREDDLSLLEQENWVGDCGLLILHLIGESCGLPHAGSGAEKSVRRYCEQGGNILLLHGSSAAFWQWSWWRRIPGLRWVRPNDPDHQIPSTHPKGACRVAKAKTRYPLAAELKDFDLPEDEIYTALEETSPVRILMNTEAEGHTWPQCCETLSPWGGRIMSFIPGHLPVCTGNPDLIYNISILINDLLKGENHE